MGYASRNNKISQDFKLGKLKPINTLREEEIIRMNPRRAYSMGLINYDEMKRIESFNYNTKRSK